MGLPVRVTMEMLIVRRRAGNMHLMVGMRRVGVVVKNHLRTVWGVSVSFEICRKGFLYFLR